MDEMDAKTSRFVIAARHCCSSLFSRSPLRFAIVARASSLLLDFPTLLVSLLSLDRSIFLLLSMVEFAISHQTYIETSGNYISDQAFI
jgi:hypothetical protein